MEDVIEKQLMGYPLTICFIDFRNDADNTLKFCPPKKANLRLPNKAIVAISTSPFFIPNSNVPINLLATSRGGINQKRVRP